MNILLILFIFLLPISSKADFKSDKNRVCIITVYSTSVLFVVSLLTFISTLISYFKNRKLRQFKLSDPETHIYYKDKGRTPKLRRKVLEAMDKGGSVYKKPKKASKSENESKSMNTDSHSSGLLVPASKERL